MNNSEALVLLATLKAAYPDHYKYVNKEEAKGIANVWAKHFFDIPFDLVGIAADKWTHLNPKPPTISELRKEISALYWEAKEELDKHHRIKHLTADGVKYFQRMKEISSNEMYRPAPLKVKQLAQYNNTEQQFYLTEGATE